MNRNELKLDWINLPPNVVAESLGLHDGHLLSISSDLLERTVMLEVDAFHIHRDFRPEKEHRFVIQLQKVQSARATTWAVWPGEIPEFRGKPMAEQAILVEEYQAKWREESMCWGNFVAAFTSNVMDIDFADVASNESATALRVQGWLSGEEFDEQYVDVFVRAGQISIRRSNGTTITVEQFIQLSEAHWQALNTDV